MGEAVLSWFAANAFSTICFVHGLRHARVCVPLPTQEQRRNFIDYVACTQLVQGHLDMAIMLGAVLVVIGVRHTSERTSTRDDRTA